jgi:hypothetical protein
MISGLTILTDGATKLTQSFTQQPQNFSIGYLISFIEYHHMSSTASAAALFGTSSLVCFFIANRKKQQQLEDDEKESFSTLQIDEILCQSPSMNFPITRRDGKDIAHIQYVIRQEILRVAGKNGKITSAQAVHLNSFAQGVWSGAQTLTQLFSLENRPYNERTAKPVNPDHWYELNTVRNNMTTRRFSNINHTSNEKHFNNLNFVQQLIIQHHYHASLSCITHHNSFL